MKTTQWILIVIALFIIFSAVIVTPFAWIGLIIFLFGLYQLIQRNKGRITFSKPGWIITAGFLISCVMAMNFVEPINKKVDNKNNKENEMINSEDEKSTTSKTSTAKPVKKIKKKNSLNHKTKRVSVTLTETVDGDTIKVMYKGKEETVRYLLIDTPESKKPATCVQPFAKDAYNRNKQLVNSGKLTLEFEKSKRDKYDRLLAYVFIDDKSVQEALLKEGYARIAYIYEPPYKYLSIYEKAENTAKVKKLKIWSKTGLVTDLGFKGCAKQKPKSKKIDKKQYSNTTNNGPEYFANCTELRKKYPNGVPSTHPAYAPKHDRDKDNYACERY